MNRPNDPNSMGQRKRFLAAAVLAAVLVFSSSVTGQELGRSTVIKNVRIFDGSRVIPLGTVVIRDGKIKEVGGRISIPECSEVIDGEGQTLLPGLIDAHVHIWDAQQLRQSLVFGVTTVVDMGMDVETMAKIKKQQLSGKAVELASLVSSGSLVTAPGGHGTEYGIPFPTIKKPEEAQAFVDDRIAEGSDFIKIIYDDGLAHLFCDDAFDQEFGGLAARHKVFVIPIFAVLENVSGTSGAPELIEDTFLSPYLKPADIISLKQTLAFGQRRSDKRHQGNT